MENEKTSQKKNKLPTKESNNPWPPSEPKQRNPQNPQIPIGIVYGGPKIFGVLRRGSGCAAEKRNN